MALTPSQRPTREWLLLVLAFVLVAAVCTPLWQWSSHGAAEADFWAKWTPERIGRLLLGPEQIACYCCTVWAGFIIWSRFAEVRRQRAAFTQDLLPTDEGARILPEDARPLVRKLDMAASRRGPTILGTMARLALNKFAISRSATTGAFRLLRCQNDRERSLGRSSVWMKSTARSARRLCSSPSRVRA